MIKLNELYYHHQRHSHQYEADYVGWEETVISHDKRKLRHILRKAGVVGKIETLVK
ncbi:hypothetical protein S140_149 [Shewanella sp. phage 1/40]|uniref:hypothetical protein n=1 Tax=Shewanella phage 1/4 TaxID=1458859 RepID=UPI0004F5FD98|nr:hypothetical protein S14_146 [Shewanella sp. phage 1/4]YP_009104147.1 hypothetical protein S140_149 [Shewanella sp. phage 1/40]AHK11255.1 hypothetical protein S14_146 [Shewanella sp. phage 1/4]AHK11556.1 hypothetical protein S140_149 [Shewanella sp. phage 1/40]